MTHDEAKHLLAPLARPDRGDAAIDVSDWVMRDVRALAPARRRRDDDAFIWRVAALCAGAAAIVVVGLATLATTVTADENPLVEFAAATSTFAAEAR